MSTIQKAESVAFGAPWPGYAGLGMGLTGPTGRAYSGHGDLGDSNAPGASPAGAAGPVGGLSEGWDPSIDGNLFVVPATARGGAFHVPAASATGPTGRRHHASYGAATGSRPFIPPVGGATGPTSRGVCAAGGPGGGNAGFAGATGPTGRGPQAA